MQKELGFLESVRQFLLSKGFKVETLALLNEENLIKLAAEYQFKNISVIAI